MKYFDDYVSQFDMNIIPIKYRYNHSYWVMGNIEIIAKSLGLTKYDIELAKCIGLLHDIGRFDQYTEYKNYKDNHLDHGYHGVDIIKISLISASIKVLKG